MKNSLTLLTCIAVLVLGLFTSCKTEPQTGTTKVIETGPFTVTSRLRAEPDRLNPLLTWRSWSIHVNNHIFLPLMEYHPQQLELSPILVKARPQITELNDGPYKGSISYAFEIHDNAVWDNGEAITGEDYLFSVKAVMNPKTTGAAQIYRSYLSLIKAVEIDSDNPRKFSVIISPPYFRGEYLASGFGLLPESVYDPEGLMRQFKLSDLSDLAKAQKIAQENPAIQQFADAFNSDKYSREVVSGAGAYRLAEWVSGEKLVLEKKDNWWGDALSEKYPLLTAHPQRLVFRPISDATATISLMRNQEIDIANAIPNTIFLDLQKDETFKKQYHLISPPTHIQNFIDINTRQAKLSDKRVRLALAHLLDTEEVIKTVKQGMASPIASPIPPSMDYYHKGLAPIQLDVNKAQTLLAEAGWTDTNNDGTVDKVLEGQREEMVLSVLLTPNNDVSTNIALILQNNAKKAGVKIDLKVEEANSVRDRLKKRDFDLFSSANAPDTDFYDPHQIWHTSSDVPGGGNRTGFGNAETDRLIEDLRKSMDPVKRKELYLRFQEVLYDEQPTIYMYNTNDCMIINKRLANVEPTLRTPGYFENFFQLNSNN